MTSKPVTALLADLDVLKSHSLPKASNFDTYSETWFETLKYLPKFPARYGSLTDSRDFIQRFVLAYNGNLGHSGMRSHTSTDVSFGMTGHVEDQWCTALQKA